MNKSTQNYGTMASSPEISFAGAELSDFNILCDNIVTNIYTINSCCKTLNSALKNIGTKKDNHGLRNTIHVTQISTNKIASVVSKDIRNLKTQHSKTDKQKQLQIEKLEENFMETIGRYSSLQKEIASKQKAHLLVSVSIEIEDQTENEEQRQAMLSREMAFDQEMLVERESRIKQIEADVLDVNEIMRELGTFVQEQGRQIDTIENSIDRAVGNVEEGTEQLIKASRYQGRRRRKLLYLVLVFTVIVVAVLVLIFLTSK